MFHRMSLTFFKRCTDAAVTTAVSAASIGVMIAASVAENTETQKSGYEYVPFVGIVPKIKVPRDSSKVATPTPQKR